MNLGVLTVAVALWRRTRLLVVLLLEAIPIWLTLLRAHLGSCGPRRFDHLLVF
jgi:hypothetical protein